MRKILKLFIMLIFLFVYPSLFAEERQSYESTVDYILKTQKLWGISGVAVNEDGKVTLIDAKDSGYGYALFIFDAGGGFLEKMTLSPGESFVLTDGDHAFITYKLIKAEKDEMTFEVTDKFDARSFGGEVKVETKEVVIKPYATE